MSTIKVALYILTSSKPTIHEVPAGHMASLIEAWTDGRAEYDFEGGTLIEFTDVWKITLEDVSE